MASAEFLRAKVKEIRELVERAASPELIAQLELWAREFEEEAKCAELALPPGPAAV
jgi:hypothetical protein